MASERQVAANRRNARRSTGPRSDAGKKRASRNSCRHGLSARQTLNAECAAQVEALARRIVADSNNVVDIYRARRFAQAQFDLAQIRLAKVALISHAALFGSVGGPRPFATLDQGRRLLKLVIRGLARRQPVESIAAMPITEPERSVEAIRRLLPELIMLDRYERRTIGRRSRALLTIFDRKS